MKETIQAILARVVPNAFVILNEGVCSWTKRNEIKIMIAATDDLINNVRGQYPACVSLLLDVDALELKPQVFGGNGGQHIYREPNKEIPNEKYLAMKGIKIPFRKPQANEAAVLKAIEKFAVNWRETVKENLPVICHRREYDMEKCTRI